MRVCAVLFLLCSGFLANAQDNTVRVSGHIYNENGMPAANIMVINQAMGTGSFSKGDGSFSITLQRPDTLLIAATGYASRKYCFRDSLGKSSFELEVYLHRPLYQLSELTVFPIKSQEEIQKEIDRLKAKPQAGTYQNVSALGSPITALYQAFSRRERSMRAVAELENEKEVRRILKDLFRLYVDYDIIYLTDDEFDGFIDFLSLSVEEIQSASPYDLALYIQKKFDIYQRNLPPKDR